MSVGNFGKAAGKALPTGVGKGREAWASAHTHFLLDLLLASLSSLMLKRSSMGRSEAAFCRACAASEITKVLNAVIVLSKSPTCCSFALNCEAWQLCYGSCLFCQFSQIVVYAWNEKWKNAVLSTSGTDLQLWILEKNLRFNFRLIAVVFCIWNLVDRFWLKCSSKCILAITFKYLKHYWRTENENARRLNSCACVCRKSVLLILRITAKTQRLLHSWAILKLVEPTCLFESSRTFICSVSSVIFSYSSSWKHM